MPVIPELEELKQEDHESKAKLGYTARPYLKGWGVRGRGEEGRGGRKKGTEER